MKLGDRVKTKSFGEGTVVGFEKFTGAGNSYISSAQGVRDRVLVALDNPKAWSLASPKQPHPWMTGSDFLEPMAVPRKRITIPAGGAVELAPFVQMPKPTPLPTLDETRTTRRRPLPMTYVVRALIVVWCLSALWVYTR